MTEIIGRSKKVLEMIQLIERVAETKANILIIGESGTGKELVARMIHEFGPLKSRPFVPVNCGAIPETLIESEMFGHKKGSFTGAVAEKPGLFEAANTGTLFLDEVGELPLTMQVKLLRSIQDRTIRRVGGTEDIKVDVRIIAATNRDLESAIKQGTFREDLFYRLNVILIKTPALRERRDDIHLLAEHFLEKYSKRQNKKPPLLHPTVMKALESYAWPGNIRELENTIERAVTLCDSQMQIENLPKAIRDALGPEFLKALQEGTGAKQIAKGSKEGSELNLPPPDFSNGAIKLDKILADVERTYLLSALDYCGGVQKKAAQILGITFRSIRYRLKKLKIKGA